MTKKFNLKISMRRIGKLAEKLNLMNSYVQLATV